MKISEQWLRIWANPDVSTETLCHQLTLAGLEIGAVEPASESFSHVVVGEIIEILAHPTASHCRVCKIHIGRDQLLTIVCGANNIGLGDKVPVALPGAELPGGRQIKTQKVHGISSSGMLCSAEELGLGLHQAGEVSEGILLLDKSAPLGQNCFDYFQLNDRIIEVELTPNRGDCLSIAGVAREVGVLFQQPVTMVHPETVSVTNEERVQVQKLAKDACPRYVARVVTGIDNQARAPLWMRERLRRSGIRSIHAVVDVMNYVMLECGQPMHAYDWHKVQGDVHIRFARKGELFTLLDKREVKLDADMLVIADQKTPLAIAGIMGGLESGVTENTTSVLLESAYFTPSVIAGRPRRLNAITDASYRFERGVDPFLQVKAVERATELLLSIVGGDAGPITEAVNPSELPPRELIVLRRSKIEHLLGMNVEDQQVVRILTALGMQLTTVEEGWHVLAPSHRFDIRIEVDLIEEIARIIGYNQLQGTATQVATAFHPVSEQTVSVTSFTDTLVKLGYQEVITYSFVDPVKQRILEPELSPLALLNPISEDMSVMRTTLWTGLLTTLIYNQNRQVDSGRYFETGLCFIPDTAGTLQQDQMIAGLMSGNFAPLQWAEKSRVCDFYDIKGDVEALLAQTLASHEFEWRAGEHSALHPGQTASLWRQGDFVGYVGALHPSVKESLNITGPVFLFELHLKRMLDARVPKFQALSKFPVIRRDLAFVVDESIHALEMEQAIRSVSCEFLQAVTFFDVYRGKGIATGKKSIALGLILRHQSRTLVDDEVNEYINEVVNTLGTAISAQMRE